MAYVVMAYVVMAAGFVKGHARLPMHIVRARARTHARQALNQPGAVKLNTDMLYAQVTARMHTCTLARALTHSASMCAGLRDDHSALY